MIHQDNSKKACLLMHGHFKKATQTSLENNSDFKNEMKGDPFKMSDKIKLKTCNPSKVKCPCTTSEQLD